MTPVQGLEPFFRPASIAIIGASEDPLKFGNWVTATVVKSMFQGEIYLINSRADTIYGRQAYPSILDTPGPVDLAGIILPSKVVPEVLAQCVEKGVQGVIIFTSGFKEIGAAGVEREKEIMEIARNGNIRLCGPNCMGIFSAETDMNMTILAAQEPGHVAFITQSGGYGAEIWGSMMNKGIQFSKFISTGDKADLKDWEYLEYVGADPDTNAILLYLEGFEEGEGRKFFDVARQITPHKPIFAIKIGRTTAGGEAARSHTGALAGEDAIYDAAFKQAGIIRATDIEELYDYIKAYCTQPLPKGNRVGMLVGSGGIGCAAVDKCYELGLEVPRLSEKSTEKLKAILPEFASVSNPVDFTASGAPELLTSLDTLETIFSDPNVDSWFFGFTGSAVAGLDEIIDRFKPIVESVTPEDIIGPNPPTCVGCIGEGDKLISYFITKMFGPTFFSTPERAIRALAALYRYKVMLDDMSAEQSSSDIEGDRATCEEIITAALGEGRFELTESASRKIMAAYEIPTPESFVAETKAEALQYASQIGYPIAMKIASPDILHKSDANGVRLNINGEEEVSSCFDEIVANALIYKPDANIAGVMVQKMAPPGVEVIIGAKLDPQFGPALLFGLGGIFTELLKDFSLRLAPLTPLDAERMIGDLKTQRLLNGFRQFQPVNRGALGSILMKVSSLVQDHPRIKEIDLNPVIAFDNGAIAVDVRILLKDE
jgi:acetyltransferase